MDLNGKRVLVTGATGLLGGATVDQLVPRHEVTVRVFARDPDKLSRFAGYPLEAHIGDITDRSAVRRAVAECDVVIHSVMAKGGADTRLVNIGGTRHVLEAALDLGVQRVVHISSSVVYMPWPHGVVDETCPRTPDGSGTSYLDTKLESEDLALQYFREKGLSVVVIQPVAVYGPRAEAWTIGVLNQLKANTVVLINGATAYHNFAYVDDLARGMILAAEADDVDGETFIIGGSESILIRDFYAAYEEMLGVRSTVSASREELENVGEDPSAVALRHGASIDKRAVVASTFPTRTFFSSDKARSSLGYEPQFRFDRGIQLTEEWARREGLLDV